MPVRRMGDPVIRAAPAACWLCVVGCRDDGGGRALAGGGGGRLTAAKRVATAPSRGDGRLRVETIVSTARGATVRGCGRRAERGDLGAGRPGGGHAPGPAGAVTRRYHHLISIVVLTVQQHRKAVFNMTGVPSHRHSPPRFSPTNTSAPPTTAHCRDGSGYVAVLDLVPLLSTRPGDGGRPSAIPQSWPNG